jgi:deferrochelatase/peroxidase EfeB
MLEGHVRLPDTRDVQGIAAFGYGKLTEARFLLLRIWNVEAARAWIASAPISTAEFRQSPPSTALQVAFTPAGLRKLGLPERIVAGFSVEYVDGMTGDANRSRRLGDIGWNDPAKWLWGSGDNATDLVVMLYAEKDLDQWQQTIQTAPWNEAFEIALTLGTSNMGGVEPFGFTDGVSQPEFDWKRQRAAASDTITYVNEVALGELLLGYPNEYGKFTDRPLLETSDDPTDQLLPAEDHTAKKDLGLNGSYFVIRQLEQDVRGFWQYLAREAGVNADDRYRLGALMVGRKTDGDPLIPDTGQQIAGVVEKPGTPRNAFTYDKDAMGTQCPFGAHIRRANPRNADLFGHPTNLLGRLECILGIPRPQMRDDLIASTRFHRVLRRGREYGEKLSPEDALKPAPADEAPRGLHFACLGANIARQFEFVQNAWLMSTTFNGLTDESDPLLGNRSAVGDRPVTGNFSIPRDGKAARRLTGVPQFITVRGGGYFFLPSLRALRYIVRAGKIPA